VAAVSAATSSASSAATGRDTYARLWRWHFYAAFLVIPFVLWQSVTGTLYLWHEELADRQHAALRFVEPRAERASYADQLAAARLAVPDARVSHVVIPDEPRRATMVVMQGANGLPEPVFLDPYDGRVLGRVDGTGWLPGLTRALHGGWPLGDWGSYLLELGASWAIVMVLTGLYLWWPRQARGLAGVLYPRLRAGPRVLWRDLHAVTGVWISLVLLGFLATALPWTKLWGGEILGPVQRALGQSPPAAASFGPVPYRSTTGAGSREHSLDEIVGIARREGLTATLHVRLGRGEQPISVRSSAARASDERQLLIDRGTGAVLARADWADMPPLARAIATGVDLHEGRLFGRANQWVNTAITATLVWLAVSGFVGWYRRRPAGGLSAPPRLDRRVARPVLVAGIVLCTALPLLGTSVLLLWLLDRALAVRGRDGATPA
jgi:uncharacterized iron-regulated membrane protein